MATNPFDRVKIPRPRGEVIPGFVDYQIRQLLDVTDTSTVEGYRDYTIILALLSTMVTASISISTLG